MGAFGTIMHTNNRPEGHPPLGSLRVDTDSLSVDGGSVTLSWTSHDADSVWIDQGIGTVPLNGSQQVLVYHTTTFTISFRNEWGITQDSCSVFVKLLQSPVAFLLAQNYPNPFNPGTLIPFELAKDGHVLLVVYDLLGREVATLVSESKIAGRYEVTFAPRNLASGVYLYRLQAGSFHDVKKLLLMR